MKNFSKLFAYAAIFFSPVLLFAATAGQAEAADPMKDLGKLTPPRTAICFFDGERVGDLAVNARGKLTFLYVDNKLADALSRQRKQELNQGPSSAVPPQVYAYAPKARSKKKFALFLTRVQALKGWDFDASLISVGGYRLGEKDIIKGAGDNPARELGYAATELAKGYDGFIGFFVPSENVRPGEEMTIGYGADRVAWIVPDKNQ
jgi:hypothetical protein